jgi:hypothetical protein
MVDARYLRKATTLSIRSLSYLAVQRDKAQPNQVAAGGGGAAAAPDAGAAQIPQQFADVLTSAIPTEPLTAYTAILGLIVGVIDATKPHQYLPLRWWLYAGFLVLIVVAVGVTYAHKANGPDGPRAPAKTRVFPWVEGLAALIAGAAWGLAMPGSALNGQLTGNLRAITSAVIAIGGAAVLAVVFVPPLKGGTKNPGESPSGGAPARQRALAPSGLSPAPVLDASPAPDAPPSAAAGEPAAVGAPVADPIGHPDEPPVEP